MIRENDWKNMKNNSNSLEPNLNYTNIYTKWHNKTQNLNHHKSPLNLPQMYSTELSKAEFRYYFKVSQHQLVEVTTCKKGSIKLNCFIN